MLTFTAAALVGISVGSFATLIPERKSPLSLEPLPHILGGIALCVEAGLDLTHAVAEIAGPRRHEPLYGLFYTLTQEIEAGATKAEAWRRLAERAGNHAQLTMLAASIIQAEALGTPLAPLLRRQAESLLENRFQTAERAAGQAPIKMLLPMLCVFVAVFVIVLGCTFLSLAGVVQ